MHRWGPTGPHRCTRRQHRAPSGGYRDRRTVRLAALRAGALLAVRLRAGAFLAVRLRAGAFLAVRLAADFLAVRLRAGALLAVRLAADFLAVRLRAGAFLAVRLAADFLAADFLAGAFFTALLAVDLRAAVRLAGLLRAGLLAAAFLTAMDVSSLGFNADLNAEPVANRTPFDAGIGTTAPVLGFRPTRGPRAIGLNAPNPVTVTFRPERTSVTIVSNKVSTTSSTACRDEYVDSLTALTS
jgi:hypothetical protein